MIQDTIEPNLRIANTLYCWETIEESTSVFQILASTSEIDKLFEDLDRTRGVMSSGTSVYILSDDRDGRLVLTRMERDSYQVTSAPLNSEISATYPRPWMISTNDVVMLAGVDETGTNHIIGVTFTRQEPEGTQRQGEKLEPTISYVETDWLSTSSRIGKFTVSRNGDRLALALSLDDGTGKFGLFFIDGPGEEPRRVGEYPVHDLGGFSPDGEKYLATFELRNKVDLYLIDTETLDIVAVTNVPIGFISGDPAWHPNGRYFLYNTNFTTELKEHATVLSGDQLYLYSLDSRNERRLTAFQDTDLWVDFSPMGDFILYASTRGVVGRVGRVGRQAQEEAEEGSQGNDSLETWRLYYIPWIEEDFISSNQRILTPDEIQFFVSWTVGTDQDKFGFAWGPG